MPEPVVAQPVVQQPVTGVQSLERGLAVIRAFDAEHGEMTLSEVARRTGMSRASARRFLHTLVALGYTGTDGRLFWLRPRILELGYGYLASADLPGIATPHLKALSDAVHESSSLAVLDGSDVVYVARIPARRIMAVAITVGTRFPAYATSLGRVILAGLPEDECERVLAGGGLHALTPHTLTDPDALLAELERVRRQGFAVVDQELEGGLRSVAVPVRDRDGAVVAAVNLSHPSGALTLAEVRGTLLPALQGARDAIEVDLRAARAVGAGR